MNKHNFYPHLHGALALSICRSVVEVTEGSCVYLPFICNHPILLNIATTKPIVAIVRANTKFHQWAVTIRFRIRLSDSGVTPR